MLVDDLECVNEQLYFNALAFENIPIEKEVNNDEEVDWTSLCLELEEYIMYMVTSDSANASFYHQGINCEALFEAIMLAGGNIQTAADSIHHTINIVAKAKPCRHLMNGNCARSDCWFQHNLKEIPCRYWLSGAGCKVQGVDGKECQFLHAIVATNNIENTVDSNETNNLLLDEASFPSLIPTNFNNNADKSSNNNNNFYNNKINSTSIHKMILNKKVNKEFTLDNEAFPDLNEAAMLKAISMIDDSCEPYQYADVLKTVFQDEMVHPTAPTATSKFKPYSYEMDSGISDYKLIKAWVESGDCVAHTYSSLREDARILAINRNKMLEAATNAFLCGKKDIARNLSRQGQLLNIQMKQLHVEAAKTIFSKRNPESLIRRGQIDLHGLHIQEAIACLDELIPALLNETVLTHVNIVTGTGHHSTGPVKGESVLFNAIKQYFLEWGHKITAIIDNKGYIGGLKIQLRV